MSDKCAVDFLFMDDAFCETTMISSLTALVVPTEQYSDANDAFYNVLLPFISPRPNVMSSAPEVHGMDLPGESDEEKLRVVEKIVDLVVGARLPVYRAGYYITKSIRNRFKDDQKMLGVCWASLQHMIEGRLARGFVIPVMDGFDKHCVSQFSSPLKFGNEMRAADRGSFLSVKYSENFLGEVFYADSRYSAFTQVVDIVAYLRKIVDLENDGHELPPFKRSLRPFAVQLDSAVVVEEIIAMTIDGVPHGPLNRSQRPTGSGALSCALTIIPSDENDLSYHRTLHRNKLSSSTSKSPPP